LAPARARWVAAAAAVVVGIAFLDGGRGEPDALAALTGAPEYPSVTGEAKVYDSDDDGGTLVLRLRSTPPPPAGHHYEVWVLRNGVELMEPAGDLSVAANHTEDDEHEFRLTGAGALAAVDVSVEPNDGDPKHSGVSLAGGRFTS
ncbi:MAG: anti-sigma factor, partial [Actinobacteria bacterium]|nr:anti-sigma factor [Actinomycetota bacterium]